MFMTSSLRLPFAALIFLCVISLVTPSAWSSVSTLGQCPRCLTAQNIKLPATLTMTLVDNQGASTAASYPTDTPTNVPDGYDLHNVPYNAWCVDGFGLHVMVSAHTVTPISTVNLAPSWGTNWSKVNYLLNHKIGSDYRDVQRDIWLLLGLFVDPNFPETTNSLAMLADANANGAGFVPSYGQVLGIVMQEDGPGGSSQDTMIEFRIPPCGAIGDFVWQDTNKDGIQNDGNAGINGVIVKLTDSTSASITTVTGNAPNGYSMLPGLPPNAPGYYQFTGLCAGTYTVSVDSNQTPLLNFTPTTVNAGSDTTIDSNLHSGAPVTLATDTAVDETTDFGYVPKAPITLTCAGGIGQQNVFYSSSLVATGGTSPYTYSIIGAALPANLTLNTLSGLISGTPILSGSFSYTAQVTDFTGQTSRAAGENCPLVINPPPTANCVAIIAVQGVAITPVTLTGSGGAGGPYTFTASGLPAGLTISSNGTISGTPTVNGTFSYTVTITDKDGNVGTSNCSVTVNPPPTTTCAVITAIQGVAITPVTMTGSGGAGGPYTFSATGLPAGITMSTGGTISGTPTVSGTFSYTVTVTDKAGNTGTLNCSVTVNPPPSATCAVITAIQGVAITPVTMTGSGGAGGPYTFSATGLPAGITMSTGGTISGTPTVNGTFNYTVTVTDKSGNTGTLNCSVTVAPPPTATCAVITAVQGVAITPVTMTGSGGAGGPYTFSASGLPAGITMSSSGTISGTPTVSGTFSYTVTVKDSAGNTGTLNCSVTVNPPVSATCVSITAVQGVAITPVTMIASGGVGGPYTFTATGLPAGITMSSTGTISGTPTVSGTFSYTVTVTDKAGNTGTLNCSVTVNPPPTATCAVITAVQGVAITPVTMIASGGVGGPYTFTATGLPAGITMSSTGTISGTPTVNGTFSYTVTVTDKAGNTGTLHSIF